MISIELTPASVKQRDVIENLWQLYTHDFTEYIDEQVNEHGLFPFDFDFRRYWEQAGFFPYLARVHGRIAGFSLVSSRIHYASGPGRHVDEFFVLRRYRGRGIGRSLAFQTFDTYQGYWEVSEIGPNLPAQAFWRKVIGDYTDHQFKELTDKSGSMDIVCQTFTTNP